MMKQEMAAVLLMAGFFMSWQSSPATVRDFSVSTGPLIVGLPTWDGRDINLVSGQPEIYIPLKHLPVARYEQKRTIYHGSGCNFCQSKVCVIDLDKDIACRGSCHFD
jgi:hypothetical protein